VCSAQSRALSCNPSARLQKVTHLAASRSANPRAAQHVSHGRRRTNAGRVQRVNYKDLRKLKPGKTAGNIVRGLRWIAQPQGVSRRILGDAVALSAANDGQRLRFQLADLEGSSGRQVDSEWKLYELGRDAHRLALPRTRTEES